MNSVNWLSDVEGVDVWSNNSVIYRLSAGFQLSVITPNGLVTPQITITSCEASDLTQGRVYYKSYNEAGVSIPPIKVFWGCFARDTLVYLENGSKKRMDELEAGDKVIAYGGHIVTFTENISGDEKAILKIVTDKGTVRLTGGHPVMKGDGTIVYSETIAAGDILMGEGGCHTVTEVLKDEYNDKVFNPVFEESGDNGVFILTDGFYCGDYYAQNNIIEEKSELSAEDKALVRQFEALNKSVQCAERLISW
jgi:hypothetical protein